MLTRWSPVRDLMSMRSEMDRMLENALRTWPTETNGGSGLRAVDVDMYENDDEFVIKAELPGLSADVDPDHSEAEFENGILTIHLPKVEEAKPKQITIRTTA